MGQSKGVHALSLGVRMGERPETGPFTIQLHTYHDQLASSSCTPSFAAAITSQWFIPLWIHHWPPPLRKESPGTGEMGQKLNVLAALTDIKLFFKILLIRKYTATWGRA